MQPVPNIGDKHSFFDDGKMSESRHYIAEVLRIITPEEAKTIVFEITHYDMLNNVSQVHESLYDIWRNEVNGHRQSENFTVLSEGADTSPGAPWCYAEETDYFVECSIPKYDEHTIWFVRHVNGGWFSMDIQQGWMSGRLMPVEFNFDEYLQKEKEEWEQWLAKHRKNEN
jgi:hypothetical protein